MAMGSADLGMTLGPSTGYHVTLDHWASASSPSCPQLLFLPCCLHHSQQEPAAGKAAMPLLSCYLTLHSLILEDWLSRGCH